MKKNILLGSLGITGLATFCGITSVVTASLTLGTVGLILVAAGMGSFVIGLAFPKD